MTFPAFLPGLVSITFRKLSPTELIELVAKAGLRGIEWGGDVHVPPGNLANAASVGRATRDAGLVSAAYGSYYRAGTESPDAFPRIIDTALALGTKIIRIWVGKVGSDQADEATRAHIIDDCRHIAELAEKAGLSIACEWHGGTLTDTGESAQAVLAAVQSPAFKTYWQPRTKQPVAVSLADLPIALPRLAGVHVFHWHPETAERLPLAGGEADWKTYLARLTPTAREAGGLYALIEFVRKEAPDQFLADAAVLKRWLGE